LQNRYDSNLYFSTQMIDYELIDCGDFEKLERFGAYFLIRPETQAIWRKRLSDDEWLKIAHARYKREQQKRSYRSGDPENGGWTMLKKMPEHWTISIQLPQGAISMKLSLTSFGHIGIFPEQASNWQFIYESVTNPNWQSPPRVLNTFAYTGGASLVARYAGAEVTHLDAVKQIVSWSKENMEQSKLKDIRWIVDDALKFLLREQRRGSVYQGIILDPPAYGRGPNGERWILDEAINEVLQASAAILDPKNNFLVLNLYSLGYSPLVAKNLVESHFHCPKKEFGESFLSSKSGIDLPLGVYVRFRNGV